MYISQLQLSENLLRAMYSLRLQIEIAEHRRLQLTNTVEDLAQLLAVASCSHHPLVNSAYAKFIRLLGNEKLVEFEAMGLAVKCVAMSAASSVDQSSSS